MALDFADRKPLDQDMYMFGIQRARKLKTRYSDEVRGNKQNCELKLNLLGYRQTDEGGGENPKANAARAF